MPNWTTNTIRAEGPEADMKTFLAHVRAEDEPFDFNTLIPMPELLRHTGSGNKTIDGQRVSSWYVVDPARGHGPRDPNHPPNERLFTPEEEAALRDIGYSNWYDWACANWGTKWNACDATVEPLPGDDRAVEIRFNTAWSAPFQIIKALAARFPSISFEFSWSDEDEPEVTHTMTIAAGGAR